MDSVNSLRDLNLKLKKKKSNKKDSIVFKIWTKVKDSNKEFFTEASTLNHYNDKWNKSKCPYCTEKYNNKNLVSQDPPLKPRRLPGIRNSVVDKYPVSWTFECPKCSSTLKVYNI